MNKIFTAAAAALTAAAITFGTLGATAGTAAAGSLNVAPAVAADTAATQDNSSNIVNVHWRRHNRWHRHHRWGYYGRYAYYGPRCFWKRVTKKRWDRYGYPYYVRKNIRICR